MTYALRSRCTNSLVRAFVRFFKGHPLSSIRCSFPDIALNDIDYLSLSPETSKSTLSVAALRAETNGVSRGLLCEIVRVESFDY